MVRELYMCRAMQRAVPGGVRGGDHCMWHGLRTDAKGEDGQCGVAGDVRTSQRVDGAPWRRAAAVVAAYIFGESVCNVLSKGIWRNV